METDPSGHGHRRAAFQQSRIALVHSLALYIPSCPNLPQKCFFMDGLNRFD